MFENTSFECTNLSSWQAYLPTEIGEKIALRFKGRPMKVDGKSYYKKQWYFVDSERNLFHVYKTVSGSTRYNLAGYDIPNDQVVAFVDWVKSI